VITDVLEQENRNIPLSFRQTHSDLYQHYLNLKENSGWLAVTTLPSCSSSYAITDRAVESGKATGSLI